MIALGDAGSLVHRLCLFNGANVEREIDAGGHLLELTADALLLIGDVLLGLQCPPGAPTGSLAALGQVVNEHWLHLQGVTDRLLPGRVRGPQGRRRKRAQGSNASLRQKAAAADRRTARFRCTLITR